MEEKRETERLWFLIAFPARLNTNEIVPCQDGEGNVVVTRDFFCFGETKMNLCLYDKEKWKWKEESSKFLYCN